VFDSLAPPPGDFDGNGRVDGADLAVWRSQFGQTGIASADANQDGQVNGEDILIWQRSTGTANSSASSQSVPEPCGVLLMLAASIDFMELCCRQRADNRIKSKKTMSFDQSF
jgi:hypothetical protein